jgi:hypothetical protein
MSTTRRRLPAARLAAAITGTALVAFVGTAPATAAPAPAAVPAVSPARPGSDHHGETLQLVAKGGTITPIDLGAKGFGPGDEYVLSDRLYLIGRRVGRDVGTCTVVTAEGDAVCDVVLVLRAGQLVVHGLLPATGHAFRLAVTGGTGRYATARGDVLLRQGETSSSLTVRLAPTAG